jgi:peptidoglycan/LPS O-acetylase OafA/YrhL
LAVLAVLSAHTGVMLALGGWLGVDVFFVLSGFLITSLLLKEHAATGRISLRNFYARRALRLYPAVVVLLVVGLAFYRQLGNQPGGSGESTLAGYGLTAVVVATYTMDLVFGLTGQPVGQMSHTWSLAVEEQFYLLWPLVLLFLLRAGRRVVVWAAVIALASLVTMWALIPPSASGSPDYAYYLPVSRFWELMVGCAVAALVERRQIPSWLTRTWISYVAVVTVGATLLVAAYVGSRLPYPRAGGGSVMGWAIPLVVAAVAVILVHLTAGPPSRMAWLLGRRPLVWLGRRSYGVYLYHFPILVVLEHFVAERRMVVALLMLVLTLVMADASYRLVERPFLRLKRRFSRVPVSQVSESVAPLS